MASFMTSRMCRRASRAWFSAPASTVGGDAVELGVELDGRDELRVPATLKSMSPNASSAPRMSVRAAYWVLPSTSAGDQTHRDAGDRSLQRHTGVEQGQRGGADRAHRRRAVGAESLGHLADRVGELLAGRQHRHQGALGERTVADLATLRRTHAAGLAGGVRREVVVVHVALARHRATACRSAAPCVSMFSVVTPMIWVSPRSKIAEPWTRGSTSTSAESGRMSVRPRPSMRTLSLRMRWRTSFLVHRAEGGGQLLLAALELLAERSRASTP